MTDNIPTEDDLEGEWVSRSLMYGIGFAILALITGSWIITLGAALVLYVGICETLQYRRSNSIFSLKDEVESA